MMKRQVNIEKLHYMSFKEHVQINSDLMWQKTENSK